MDPFVVALDALFRAPGSAAAVYTPAGGPPAGIRVIPSRKTIELPGGQYLADTDFAQIRRSEAPDPQIGDQLVIGTETFRLQAGARLDVEGLTWDCPLEPA